VETGYRCSRRDDVGLEHLLPELVKVGIMRRHGGLVEALVAEEATKVAGIGVGTSVEHLAGMVLVMTFTTLSCCAPLTSIEQVRRPRGTSRKFQIWASKYCVSRFCHS
jgi:hypothetical protein